MNVCADCGRDVEAVFRFCPFCGRPQRTKLVEFFLPHPAVPDDARKALRVSRYFGGNARPPQVRFSIWDEDVASAALSLAEAEALRLAHFLAPPPAHRGLLDELRTSLFGPSHASVAAGEEQRQRHH